LYKVHQKKKALESFSKAFFFWYLGRDLNPHVPKNKGF